MESPTGNSNAARLKSNSGLEFSSSLSPNKPLITQGLFPLASLSPRIISLPFSSSLSLLLPATSILCPSLPSSYLDHGRALQACYPLCESLPSLFHPEPADTHVPYKNTLDALTSLQSKVQSLSCDSQGPF